MSRKGSKLNESDAYFASMHNYLINLLARNASLDGELKDFSQQREAAQELYKITVHSADTGKQLELWVNKFLTSRQRSNMLAALRQRRRRAYGVGKTITISNKAYSMLATLAEGDGLTFSKTLEKRLLYAYKAELKRKY